MIYGFVDVQKAYHAITDLCRVTEVSRSGYYDWRRSTAATLLTPRQTANEAIRKALRRIHAKENGWCGYRRMRSLLAQEDGFIISKGRTRRLMRVEQLVNRRPKRYKVTTDSNHNDPITPNVLNRNFTTDAPNKAWVGDITYIRTHEGWLYLAVLVDLYSRRVVGWSMSLSLDRQLCLDALDMAVRDRNPAPGLIHHSDRGCQYTSFDYRAALEDHNFVCSMSRRGNCWDNAVAESFFATLKSEVLYRRTLATRKEARAVIFEYLESYYNRKRLHSTLNYKSPVAFEAMANTRTKAA